MAKKQKCGRQVCVECFFRAIDGVLVYKKNGVVIKTAPFFNKKISNFFVFGYFRRSLDLSREICYNKRDKSKEQNQ